MCGIVAIFASMMKETELRQAALEAGKRIQHRGPDWNGIRVFPEKGIAIEHERLAIIDPESGAQPLVSNDPERSITLAVNGEIYNYKQLAAELPTPYEFMTKSDCEIIIPLYQQYGHQLCAHAARHVLVRALRRPRRICSSRRATTWASRRCTTATAQTAASGSPPR
ncbi:hypothetical protein PINS_up021967 [Pythium insidiosum]|nr:hypothetical protein PINS_up021967 [Pythium insidiosum]